MSEIINKIHPTYYISQPNNKQRLTKYEETRIVGLRAEQLANGGKALVDVDEDLKMNWIAIAEKELREKKIPFTLYREYPDGSKKKFVLN